MNLRCRDFGNLTINDVCRLHSAAFNDACKRMIAKGYPFHECKHIFDSSADEDEYILWDLSIGYQLEKCIDGEGFLQIRVVWGHFVDGNVGKVWKQLPESNIVKAPGGYIGTH